jgi:predicted amidohydrolase
MCGVVWVCRSVLAARQRGLIFDIGHGGNAFDLSVAQTALSGTHIYSIDTGYATHCATSLLSAARRYYGRSRVMKVHASV